jgi:hypothetical protein
MTNRTNTRRRVLAHARGREKGPFREGVAGENGVFAHARGRVSRP